MRLSMQDDLKAKVSDELLSLLDPKKSALQGRGCGVAEQLGEGGASETRSKKDWEFMNNCDHERAKHARA